MLIIDPEINVVIDSREGHTLIWPGSHKISEIRAWVRDIEKQCDQMEKDGMISVYTILPSVRISGGNL